MAANRHTHARAQCSHASVELAQAYPNYYPTIPQQSKPRTVSGSSKLFHVIATQIYTTYTADYTLTVRI